MTSITKIVGVAALAACSAWAQESDGARVMVVTRDINAGKIRAEGMTRVFGMAKFGVVGPAVKGAPYTADGITETTQTLGDGTHINRQETYTIYRDGEGRIRRESGDQVWITDPVANTTFILNTKEQSARKLGLSNTVVYDKAPPGTPAAMAVKMKAEAQAKALNGPLAKPAPEKHEDLGRQVMEGVQVEGSRTSETIPLGQMGNDRPLQMSHERWESPDLHVTILSKHTDPLSGDRVERLTNVRRGEPDPALFQIPAGYSVESDQ